MNTEIAELIGGALSVFVAAFLGGVTGFGYALVATPMLLLIGFPLPFVVTANLALAFVTRIPIAYRFRADIRVGRAAGMVGGSLPGLWLGTELLTGVDEHVIKLAAGIVVMAAALLLRSLTAPPPRPVPGAPLAAGLAGGLLGSTTSLNGVAPVLLLARDRAAPRSFIADLAVYFVVSNAAALAFLAAAGALAGGALYPACLLWLAGNWLGTTVGPRLPEGTFRRLTLAVVFIAGAVAALTA